VLSAVDALISARLSSAAGRAAQMQTSAGLGGTQVRFSISF